MPISLPTTGFHYADYALALLSLWLVFGGVRKWREYGAARRRDRAADEGIAAPPSLHPIIDAARCVGCGACTHACPEGNILGMIRGKAHLLEPAACIGHGACKAACPVGAIDLVFGSARRGVDIPVVSPEFESSVPGVYIAGELGGMGLVANAIEQGRQAIEAIARRDGPKVDGLFDVVIVGGGPAGISASLAAREKGLRHLTLEQDSLGGTVAHYPRGKLVMTRPAVLPLYGRVRLRRVRKERLLALWQEVIGKTGVKIHQGVRVEAIEPAGASFEVKTSAGVVGAKTVLLAMGRRGSPRKLGVPGEDLAKVVYRLDAPSQYRGKHVLVVGGGDSALEAATELARRPLQSLTLCYRGSAFDRAKPAIRQRFEAAVNSGRVVLLTEAHVRSIEATRVVMERAGTTRNLPNDVVIVCAGGVLPTLMLEHIGVGIERKYGTA